MLILTLVIVAGCNRSSDDERELHSISNILLNYSLHHGNHLPAAPEDLEKDPDADQRHIVRSFLERCSAYEYTGGGKEIATNISNDTVLAACIEGRWYRITRDGSVLAGQRD
jgi:hypothetical protein